MESQSASAFQGFTQRDLICTLLSENSDYENSKFTLLVILSANLQKEVRKVKMGRYFVAVSYLTFFDSDQALPPFDGCKINEL